MLRLVLKNRPPVGHRVGHGLGHRVGHGLGHVLSTPVQKRANFRLRTYTANNTILNFEIVSVKNADLINEPSKFGYFALKMKEIVQRFSK